MLTRGFKYIIQTALLNALIIMGCVKEYSYEGGSTPPVVIDTLSPPVSPPAVQLDFPLCNNCEGRDRFEENRWSFRAGNAFLCGIIDTGIVNSDRNAFTFFGVSACSPDTSMAMSIYLDPYKLDKTQSGLVINRIAFYFNKFGLTDHLLIIRQGTAFSLTIDNYDHQTKLCSGTFTGNAYKPDGNTLLVHSGKFMVKLH